ncbi:MAG: phosphatidate cytidylyltransferase [Cryomorphaceae bacterium]|jgi:phosphatidate cytidylyltransferase|nr:phosphatidate cytidylyltransferase [Cryomorphaceae bacterium]
MNNLLQRSITGALFAIVVLGSILWDAYAQALVFSVFMVLGLLEFYNLFNKHGVVRVSSEIGVFIGIFIFVLLVGFSLEWLPIISIVFIFPLFFTLILEELWRKSEHPLINISILVFGIIYIVLPFWLTIDLNLREDEQNNFMPLVVGMYLLIWTNDTFAYLTGRKFGKTKLFERISPKKTWEGTAGGILVTLLIGYIFGAFINKGQEWFWIVSAAIIAPCAIFGDLLESLFKRSLNIKDSGTILPGHGGILDRFDAALFAIPFFYCWAMVYDYFSY